MPNAHHRVEGRIDIKTGAKENIAVLVARLEHAGFRLVPQIENRGEFAVRGGIIDIYPAVEEAAVRLDFFGDQIESISQINPIGYDPIDKIDEVFLTRVDDSRTRMSEIAQELRRLKRRKPFGWRTRHCELMLNAVALYNSAECLQSSGRRKS